MENKLDKKLLDFKEYMKKIEYLSSALAVLSWDMEVYIPKKGIAYRGDVLGYLSSELYKLSTSDEMKGYIDSFTDMQNLDDVTRAMVINAKKEYDETKKIPENRYKEFVVITANAYPAWQEAKSKKDFSIFKPYLQKIVDMEKEFIEYWGYKNNKYDTLLDKYEPGFTVEKLDKIFGTLKGSIITLLTKIENSNIRIDDSFFKNNFNKEEQQRFSVYVLEKMGFDFQRGRLDETEHPFTTEFNNKDVRITTHYYENEWRSALFSSIHEGGHALYEQDIPDSLQGTGLGHGVSMGIHESQSRFYENIIGRSKEFWTFFFKEAKKVFVQFKNVNFEEFYKAINIVQESLIRTEADELTYSLHIIIRYEIEKMLINGEINVDDLPKVWNKKYKEYLHVEPSNDGEGILQDMHWAGGSFGYFPSYALGNLYGAQLLNKMKKDIPFLYEDIEKGNLDRIHSWLKDNVHKYGSIYKPYDLIKLATGEELSAEYFIDYLNNKYKEIYELE